MGNNCCKFLFIHLIDDQIVVPVFGLEGPNKTNVSVDGMYIDVIIKTIIGNGMIEVLFPCNLSGKTKRIKRCVRINGVADTDNLNDLFKDYTRARLLVIKDTGYFYIGKIYLTKADKIIDVTEYFNLQKYKPSPVLIDRMLARIDPEDQSINTAEEPVVPDKQKSLLEEPAPNDEEIIIDAEEQNGSDELSKSIGKIDFIENSF